MMELKAEEVSVQIDTDEMENIYLNFNVGSEIYGIEIRHVLQIIGMQEIVEMPDMPPDMKGFINLRGNVIPVASMRLRFGKTDESYTDRTCIIVIQAGEGEIGLVVDAILETTTIEPENISPPPAMNACNDKSYISGIATLPNDCICILVDVLRLFNEQF